MEGYEDDDDTHFCIKCHLTVHGLENYVRHRQLGCRAPDDKAEATRESPSTPTTVSYPEILNADAFFSSLELQSSAKTNPRRTATLLESGRKSKRNERRKKGQKTQVDNEEPKEKLHNMLQGVTDLEDPTDHLCMPSLVGFPDIVTSTASSKSSSTVGVGTSGKLNQSIRHSDPSYPIKHESEAALERKRPEESQRIEPDHQTWLEDTILSELVENTENKELPRYEFEYQQDVDSDEDMLDEDLGVDDSYSESDDAEDRGRSPREHTGGKWKPDLTDLHQELHEDEAEVEEDHQEHPPPTYTGGKWRPADSSQKLDDEESKDSGRQPPPGHTRGKWVPGARADIDSGYWCNPCGRKLASRLVYSRHLLSDLHAKRSLREIDGVPLSRNVDSHAGKRTYARRQLLASKMKNMEEKDEDEVPKKERGVITCEMCHSRVRKVQMGKHLLSHYHCRVGGISPKNSKARRFLLANMAHVVRQSPFQCSCCHFYCNTEDTFLLHWRSEFHRKIVEQMSGSFWCGGCDFWSSDNDSMESHLKSAAHKNVIAMINGTVPVVISRQRALSCGTCDRQFRYNLQLRFHAKESGHKESVTASDDYQKRIICSLCSRVVRSFVSLQRHQFACHIKKQDPKEKAEEAEQKPQTTSSVDEQQKQQPYFCSFCMLNFATAQEAVIHRRTSRHKEVVKAQKSSVDAVKFMTRQCPHCGEKQRSLALHKDHLLRRHPDLCHRCPKCGILCALSQDLTRHTKEKVCYKDEKATVEGSTGKEEWECDSCNFSTDSRAELLFHGALHAGPLPSQHKDEPGSSKNDAKYRCPMCKKVFSKASLRNHIRSHTGERPFPCAKCYVSFARRSDLNAHEKKCLTVSKSPSWQSQGKVEDRTRNYICSDCSDAFYTKHALRQHMLRHAGKKYKCGLPGCPTVLRTASELKYHRAVVHSSKPSDRQYRCNDCTYAAKTKTQLRRHRMRHEDPSTLEKQGIHACPYAGCSFKSRLAFHLRRHVRLHTGSKPYKCRHCNYACNNLENLRKHVLSKTLHPGKTIYECDFCTANGAQPFGTNFAKELRAHFLNSHNDYFPTPEHARNYVLNMFVSNANSESSDQPN